MSKANQNRPRKPHTGWNSLSIGLCWRRSVIITLNRIALIMMLSIFLAGCKTAKVIRFVHEGTEDDRNSLQWSKPDPVLSSELTARELPHFVVDFHSFWPGHSATAYLYVVQQDSEPIELESVEISSKETGEVRMLPLGMEASPKIMEDGLYLFRYRILDGGSSDEFAEASDLKVTLKWVDRNAAARSTEFELKKKVKSEIAWPT